MKYVTIERMRESAADKRRRLEAEGGTGEELRPTKTTTAKRPASSAIVCASADHEAIVAEAAAMLHVMANVEEPNYGGKVDSEIKAGLSVLAEQVARDLVASFDRLDGAVEGSAP
jgi:hypothetical protein